MNLLVFCFFAMTAPKNLIKAPITGLDSKIAIINWIELPEGKESPMHTHHGDEYAVVIEGSALQTLNGKTKTITKGQATHLPSGQPHKVKSVNGILKAVIFRIHEKGQPETTVIK